jgi:tetratricopeptide (TPR) repeat protein
MFHSVIHSRMVIVSCLGAALLVSTTTGAAQSPQERMQGLETALQTQPNDAVKLVALGRLYAETGRIPDGLKLLERAVSVAPHDPAARVWLGSVQTQMARTTDDLGARLQWAKRGMKTMDEAVEEFPTMAVVYLVRGINGVRLPEQFRRYALATQDLNRVLELKAQDATAVTDASMPLVYLHLGLAYKKNNQRGEARATWERGRQLYPQAKEAALIDKELRDL